MTRVVSLVIFGDGDRYWDTLPAALVGYTTLYPGFEIRLHHSDDAARHPLFPAVQALAAAVEPLRLVPVDLEYTGTEPTLWRMLPLWDGSVDVWVSRDVDSLPNADELRAVRAFTAHHAAAVHGVRSGPRHGMLLLAGLCGFKNDHLDDVRVQIGSLDHYIAIARRAGLNGSWGCDQLMLAALFEERPARVLDIPFADAPPLDLPVLTLDAGSLDAVSLGDLPASILEVCNAASPVAGQPQDDTRLALQSMLAVDHPVSVASAAALADHPAAFTRWMGTAPPTGEGRPRPGRTRS